MMVSIVFPVKDAFSAMTRPEQPCSGGGRPATRRLPGSASGGAFGPANHDPCSLSHPLADALRLAWAPESQSGTIAAPHSTPGCDIRRPLTALDETPPHCGILVAPLVTLVVMGDHCEAGCGSGTCALPPQCVRTSRPSVTAAVPDSPGQNREPTPWLLRFS